MNHARPASLTAAAAPHRCGVALLSAALLLSGCIEFNIDPIERDDPIVERATVTETFAQLALPKVDLLFVLDRTGSMGPELAALANSADLLGGQLDNAGLSWQLGVVGSEMGAADEGWLLGSPWVLTSAGDPGDHFNAIVALPVDQPQEAGIAAALAALDESAPGGANAGFRRVDASLHVVFVSDGDDESDPWVVGDPVQAMVERLDLEAANGLPARASAVVGDGSCSDTTPGLRYIDVAELTGGVVVSICENTFAPIVSELSDASVVLQDTFVLRELPANNNTIAVKVDGLPVQNWTYSEPLNAVVFEVAPPARSSIVIAYTVVVDS